MGGGASHYVLRNWAKRVEYHVIDFYVTMSSCALLMPLMSSNLPAGSQTTSKEEQCILELLAAYRDSY